jgi:hypothetical protein
MIEIQRAKLGLPPAASIPPASMHGVSRSPGKGNLQSPKATVVKETPEEAAASEQQSEDAQIQRFILRLQQRDDLHPMADSSSGPTVPAALSRRMLQRQGVGYLDDTVAAAVSASADRFLATLLQQAVACRDQRLKGAEMAREAARHRKRHMQHYEADTDNRKRRREQLEDEREKEHLTIVQVAESLKKGGASKNEDEKKKTKKKKQDDDGTNGSTSNNAQDQHDDDSYDSIDEEEEYYQEKLGDIPALKKNEDEEDDDVLLLKDLVRPLEAWDFHIDGKEALEAQEEESEEEDDGDNGDEEDPADASVAQTEDNDEDDDTASNADTPKKEKSAKNGSDAEPKTKAAPSPQTKKS